MITDHYTTAFNIYRTSASVDTNNFEIESEVLLSSNKGYFEPLSAKEIYKNDKYQTNVTHRLMTPIIDVTTKDVIEVDSISYNIDSVLNYRNHHLEITLFLEK